MWWNKINHNHPHLKTDDWKSPNSKLLFKRGSQRCQNTRYAEFLHGHSKAFQNFSRSVHCSQSGICKFCNLELEVQMLTNYLSAKLLIALTENNYCHLWKIILQISSGILQYYLIKMLIPFQLWKHFFN